MSPKRKNTPFTEPARLLLSRQSLETKLLDRAAKGRELLGARIETGEAFDETERRYLAWDRFNIDLLRRSFTNEQLADEYRHSTPTIIQPSGIEARARALHRQIKDKIGWLEALGERLDLIESSPGARLVNGPEAWIHPRLLEHVGAVIDLARRSGKSTDWGRVTRDATLFLENEIRNRSGIASHKRQQVAAEAFKWGGPLSFKSDEGWQEAWKLFVMGILGAFGNPGAHNIRSHTETFAMGVVGAVSVVLERLDEAFGPP